jgi:hypothetical protein
VVDFGDSNSPSLATGGASFAESRVRTRGSILILNSCFADDFLTVPLTDIGSSYGLVPAPTKPCGALTATQPELAENGGPGLRGKSTAQIDGARV